MASTSEVAVFIDLENLRYSTLNLYGEEPDFEVLVEKAKKYGRPSVMRAYADFSEHPTELNRNLAIVGIEAINVRVKRSTIIRDARKIERIRNAADIVMAIDALLEAGQADANQQIKTFLIVTGDADYIKLVTQIRNRFGQNVVICGVPGSVARDLEAAAGASDHFEMVKPDPVEKTELHSAIIAMVLKGPAPLKYWSVGVIDQWCQNDVHQIPGTTKEKRDAIGALLDEGALTRRTRDRPQGGQTTETTVDVEKARELGYV